MNSLVTRKDITELFQRLGITGKKVVVHSSYKSIGAVEGGAQTVVEALLDSFSTVMVPATSYRSVAKYVENDMPERNGCDYSFYDNWSRKVFPFDSAKNTIDKTMGVIAKLITELPSTHRSATPWHSWSVNGESSRELADNTDWGDTDRPLKKLIDLDGLCLMIGVDLSSCSAIHIAEELAGRKHLIRWCMDSDGKVRRVEAQSCGRGFNNLLPYFEHFIKKAKLGDAQVMVFSLKQLIREASSLIKSNPRITVCSETCIRCADSALGGPITREGGGSEG